MEFLGRESADVVSVSCSPSSATAFATLSGRGILSLWDLRLKRKNYLSLANKNTTAGADATELRYFADRHAAIALCGNTVQLYDTRKTLSVLADYAHPKECVAFLKTAPPSDADTTLIVDEDGGMFPLSLTDGTRREVLEAYVLGSPYSLSEAASTDGAWGKLDNYCSGLHCVEVSGAGGDDVSSVNGRETCRVLLAVGMDGKGALYSSTNEYSNIVLGSGAIRRTPFTIMEDPHTRQKTQLVNPPLVNCTALCGARLAVGRADGTYTIYDVETSGLQVQMEAPGHAVNGLCFVDWPSADLLITTSLCGDVTGWNVGAFLAAEEDEADEGELPAVVTAFTHREVPGCQLATVNCGDRIGDSSYVFGDTMGGVTLARVEL